MRLGLFISKKNRHLATIFCLLPHFFLNMLTRESNQEALFSSYGMPLTDKTFKVHNYHVYLQEGHIHSQQILLMPTFWWPNLKAISDDTALHLSCLKRTAMKLMHPNLEMTQVYPDYVMLPVKCLPNPV